jgi:transposase InsO family protein
MTYYRIWEANLATLCTKRGQEPFKYQFIFRHELTDFITVGALCSDFKLWYNHQRKHSAIGYSTPWATLVTQTKANL